LQLGDLRFQDPDPAPAEDTYLFGYKGRKRWELVGTIGDARKVTDPDRLLEVYRAVARGNGTEIWDAAWLKKTFGVDPKPLPPDVDSWPNDPGPVINALSRAEGLE
jgi:hypothetical protein